MTVRADLSMNEIASISEFPVACVTDYFFEYHPRFVVRAASGEVVAFVERHRHKVPGNKLKC